MRMLALLLALTIAAAAPARGQEVLLPEADLAFVANLGQLDDDTGFFVTASRFAAGLSPTGGALALRVPAPSNANGASPPATPAYDAWANAKIDVLRWQFVGGKAAPLAGDGVRPGVVHFLESEDQARWRTDVPRYSRVRYASLYPHIAHIVSGPGRALQFDFEVEPGGQPSQIAISFGNAAVSPASDGRLKLALPNGSLFLSAPLAWQGQGKDRKAVAIVYRLTQTGAVGFSVGAYDTGRTLYIDPIVDVAAYVGGEDRDWAHAIATDAMSNYYLAGETLSPELVATAPSPGIPVQYVYAAKLDSSGTLLFITVLGPGLARAIDVDAAANIHVAGITFGRWPLAGPHVTAWGGGLLDGFVAKLAASGSARIYSQYVGGRGLDVLEGMALGREDEVFLFGDTASANFPRYYDGAPAGGSISGSNDVFLMRLDPAGRPTTSFTFGSSRWDNAAGLAVDEDGSAYVTWSASAEDFPITPGAYNPLGGSGGFVAKFARVAHGPEIAGPVYSLAWAAKVGGVPLGIAVQPGARIPVVVGHTIEVGFPTTPFALREYFTRLGPDGHILESHEGGPPTCARDLPCWDGFVVKLTADGSRAIYSTFLGDYRDDHATAVAVDRAGKAYVTGRTDRPAIGTPSAFPVTPDAFQPENNGETDAFITVLNPAGTAAWFSSFYGSRGYDGGEAITLDGSRVIVAGSASAPMQGDAFLIRITP